MGSLLLILVAVALLVLGLANGSSGLLISSIGASLLAAVALVVGARQAAAMRIEVDATHREAFSPTAPGRGQPRPPTVAAFTAPAATATSRTAAPGPFAGPDPYARPDPYAGPDDPYARPGAARHPDPFSDEPDPVATPDPYSGAADPFPADPEVAGDTDPFDSPDPATRPAPAARPDPFSDAEPPAEVRVPSQGGDPEDETRWRHPAGPYRRSARTGERAATADEDGDEFAVVDIPPDEPDAQQVPAATAARIAELATDVMVIDGRPRYHLPTCPHLVGRESEPLPVGEAVELGFTPCGRCEPDDRLLADSGRV